MLNIRQISDMTFYHRYLNIIDADLDGSPEFILLNPDQEKHFILRNDLRHPVDLDLPVQSDRLLLSLKLNGNHPPQLSVQGDQNWKLFDYSVNPIYRWRFLIYVAVYAAVLLFILLIRKLYSFQLKKRYEAEKKMTQLQLSGIKAQMEPHFIMNTINMIGSSIYRQKPDEAYGQLINFSGMVRSLLLSSDKLTRTLAEELDFVKSYLELEKARFAGQFDYHIDRLDEETEDKIIIPKMIIQIHAENALKHGLLPRKEGGMLNISVIPEEGYLSILIRDNGIGRNAAVRNRSQSTGRGMKIISQLFETYNKHNRLPLRQEVTDLFDPQGAPAGTLVTIFVPLEFNTEIF
jgi:two-component sensor histidine kinase